jgi:MFS transporter, ACS family, glucarate transporter
MDHGLQVKSDSIPAAPYAAATVSAPAALAKPTNARKTVVRMSVALAFLAFLDRVCISQAAPAMMRDLHLTKIQMGYVFSAFGLSYALFEMPSGWLCDRIGARSVLTRVVLCWSALTAATGLAWSYVSLFTIRLLFGAGEAGCFPGLAKVFSIWLPTEERPLAEGWKAAMGRWGAAVTPYIVVLLYAHIGWRWAFGVFGAVGFIWAAIFFWWYRDRPQDHPGVNAAEAALIGSHTFGPEGSIHSTPWRRFARSPSAWALCIQWFCHYYGFYFYITWLPIYLQQARGLNLQKSAVFAGMPMLLAGFGPLACGLLMSPLRKALGLGRARRLVAYLSYGGAAALLLFFTFIHDPLWAMVVMSLSSFTVELSTPITWTTAMDLGGRSVGSLTGAMNTLGQMGAGVAPAVIGYLISLSSNNWSLTFYISAIVYAAGAFCWAILDPVTPIDNPG